MLCLNAPNPSFAGGLGSFGTGPERFGLIHADMRLANLIVGKGRIWLIDFDDCGFGWFLYDFATALSFIEDHPQVPKLKEAWIEGYTDFLPLSRGEIGEMDSFGHAEAHGTACMDRQQDRLHGTAAAGRQDLPEDTAELADGFLRRHG